MGKHLHIQFEIESLDLWVRAKRGKNERGHQSKVVDVVSAPAYK